MKTSRTGPESLPNATLPREVHQVPRRASSHYAASIGSGRPPSSAGGRPRAPAASRASTPTVLPRASTAVPPRPPSVEGRPAPLQPSAPPASWQQTFASLAQGSLTVSAVFQGIYLVLPRVLAGSTLVGTAGTLLVAASSWGALAGLGLGFASAAIWLLLRLFAAVGQGVRQADAPAAPSTGMPPERGSEASSGGTPPLSAMPFRSAHGASSPPTSAASPKLGQLASAFVPLLESQPQLPPQAHDRQPRSREASGQSQPDSCTVRPSPPHSCTTAPQLHDASFAENVMSRPSLLAPVEENSAAEAQWTQRYAWLWAQFEEVQKQRKEDQEEYIDDRQALCAEHSAAMADAAREKEQLRRALRKQEATQDSIELQIKDLGVARGMDEIKLARLTAQNSSLEQTTSMQRVQISDLEIEVSDLRAKAKQWQTLSKKRDRENTELEETVQSLRMQIDSMAQDLRAKPRSRRPSHDSKTSSPIFPPSLGASVVESASRRCGSPRPLRQESGAGYAFPVTVSSRSQLLSRRLATHSDGRVNVNVNGPPHSFSLQVEGSPKASVMVRSRSAPPETKAALAQPIVDASIVVEKQMLARRRSLGRSDVPAQLSMSSSGSSVRRSWHEVGTLSDLPFARPKPPRNSPRK